MKALPLHSGPGCSSAFYVLADIVLPDAAKREEFHKMIDLLINELLNARSAAREINKLWSDHARKVSQGEIARVEGSVVHIDESIDPELI